MDNKYNPFEDKTIHTTQPGNIPDDSDRQGKIFSENQVHSKPMCKYLEEGVNTQ
ncbi:hypothetical protein [Paenibacillus selenitireducens]|uniref:hypothetical protein n=1 Tax=Paenibacillus selenitireducens TaxID=1324314 RepID=UPI001302036E|nr:hypothetical protein [Paenibacillus selenitireducens]